MSSNLAIPLPLINCATFTPSVSYRGNSTVGWSGVVLDLEFGLGSELALGFELPGSERPGFELALGFGVGSGFELALGFWSWLWVRSWL